MIQVPCAICSSSDSEILCRKTVVAPGPSLLRIRTQKVCLSICRTCGFVAQNPRPSKDAYDGYYANQFDTDRRREVFSHGVTESLMRKSRLVLERIGPHVPAAEELACLDVGAGTGTILGLLKNELGESRRLSLFAIEPSDCCGAALQAAGVSVLSRYVEDDWQGSGSAFDVIIMRHVLEHFYDPLAGLRKVGSRLTRSGVAYIAVPNLLRLEPDFFRTHLTPAHMSYFSRALFVRAMAEAGLECRAVETDAREVWAVVRRSDGGAPQPDVSFENQYDVNRRWIRRQLRKDLLTVMTLGWVQRVKSTIKTAVRAGSA